MAMHIQVKSIPAKPVHLPQVAKVKNFAGGNTANLAMSQPFGGYMKTVSQTSFIDLPDLSRNEKREIWLRRTGNTLKILAQVAGVSLPTLSSQIRGSTMPVRRHEALVAYGVPPQILPEPVDQKSGPKPRTLDSVGASA